MPDGAFFKGEGNLKCQRKGGQKLEGDGTNLPLCDWQLCTALFNDAYTAAVERKTMLPAKKAISPVFMFFDG